MTGVTHSKGRFPTFNIQTELVGLLSAQSPPNRKTPKIFVLKAESLSL